jgi:hypothetical protein
LLAGLLLYVLIWGGLPFGLGFLTGRYSVNSIALRDTIRLADTTYLTQTDTLYLDRKATKKAKGASDSAKAVSDSADAKVEIIDSASVRVADTVAIVPPEVVADLLALRLTVAEQDTTIQKQGAEILRLYQRDTTQQWRIETRDRLIRELSKPKCGKKCGFLLGVATVIVVRKVTE